MAPDGSAPALGHVTSLDEGLGAAHDRAQRDDLVLRVERKGEELGVLVVELLGEPGEALALELLGREAHGQLQPLAVVAQVDLVLHGLVLARDALGIELLPSAGLKVVEDTAHLGVRGLREAPHEAHGGLVGHPRRGIAVGAEHAGRGRDDDRPRVHQLGKRVGVQRPGAAEGDQREVARIEALLHRDQPERTEHVLVDDVDDAGRSPLEIETQSRGDGLHSVDGGIDIELHLAADQLARQVAEHDVGIGDRRLVAAHPVGRRPPDRRPRSAARHEARA